MANSALPVSALSAVALSAAIDVGFNCCAVVVANDSNTFAPRLYFTFGDCARMQHRRPSRAVTDWAMSYDLDAQCIRDERTIELPESARYEPTYDLKRQLVGKLLEAVPM